MKEPKDSLREWKEEKEERDSKCIHEMSVYRGENGVKQRRVVRVEYI